MENEEKKTIYDDDELQTNAKIIVIGVGGGGSNAVNGMINDKSDEVEYWVFNTDSQALANSPCENKLILGKNVTRGLGAGGQPEMGRRAAEDSYSDIQLIVKNCDMVFIAAGEGGGTGTGAGPVVAKAAKEAGCLVLGIVTRPFNFEGKVRKLHALEGISELRKYVDALIVVSNDKMMFNNGSLSIKNAFAASDEILAQSVKTVTDLILKHGIINLDFADVKATLSDKGLSLIGIGFGQGENKALDAATNAINSPLLEASIRGAKSMIINITVGDDSSLNEVRSAINYITECAGGTDNDVNIIFGVQLGDDYHDKMKIAIIATDFNKDFSYDDSPKETSASSMENFLSGNIDDITAKKEQEEVQENYARAKQEILSEKQESALPDYLKDFLSQENPAPTIPTPMKESKEESPKPVSTKPVENDNSKLVNKPVVSDEEDEDEPIILSRN
jgi:cell division protein FtsZ